MLLYGISSLQFLPLSHQRLQVKKSRSSRSSHLWPLPLTSGLPTTLTRSVGTALLMLFLSYRRTVDGERLLCPFHCAPSKDASSRSTAEINFTLFDLHWKLLSLCSINAIGRTIANRANLVGYNALELRMHQIFCLIIVYYNQFRNNKSILTCYVTYWHGNAIYMSA